MTDIVLKDPLISIITVCRNAAEFIEQTIQGVLSQTYHRLEYLVIDGASTDGTVEIIQRYASRLAYWHSQPDRGLAHAFNLGLARAAGDWLLFLNADDFLLGPTVLEQMAPHLKAHSEADVVFGQAIFMTRRLAPTPAPMRKIFGQPWSWEQFRRQDTIPHPAAFTHRDFFARVGGFDENFRIAMDYELYLRKGEELKARFVPLVVSGMREGGLSIQGFHRTWQEGRRAQIQTRALSPGAAWLNFCWQLGRISLGRLAHALLDRWAPRISWPGRASGSAL